jgi:hypothetical protein
VEPDSLVTLRGHRGELASCSCADYAKSELQTCRHIERVRNWYRRKKKSFPEKLLSVWWQPRTWSDRVPDPLEEIRIDHPVELTS